MGSLCGSIITVIFEEESPLKHLSQVRPFTLSLIVDTSDQFSDFSPFVVSINNEGTVAFQATLRKGGAGVFTGKDGQITMVADTTSGLFSNFCSHPDINSNESLSFYADLKSGGQGVVLISDGQMITLADTGGPFKSIGPLGPTMNDQGKVAFRSGMKSELSGIFSGGRGSMTTVADTGGLFSGFQGLPVINSNGTVVFRADLKDGGQGIYTGSGGSLAIIADTSSRFRDLALFPIINDKETVAFGAALKSGGAGIFTVTGGKTTTVVDTNGPFESFRGVLINNAGSIVFYATPRGGELGIYSGPDPLADRIVSIGEPWFDSTVADFALNPVSMNDVGQVAIRVRLASDRQVIIRADPVK